MGIKVRTISTLEKKTSYEEDDLMEYSKAINTAGSTPTYQSVSIRCGHLEKQIMNSTILSSQQRFNLMNGDNPIDVLQLYNGMNSLSSESVNIYGVKTFLQNPRVYPGVDNPEDDPYYIPNVRNVRKIVSNYGDYISPDTWIEKNPMKTDDDGKTFDGSVYTEYEADNTFYYWHINDGQNDSSYYESDDGSNTVTIGNTGILNIYGWLADDGSALAQESWVGLFMKIYSENAKGQQWMPINVVPWIQGKKSSVMQYVAFNHVAIAEGSELKIMTGFKVNGKNSGLMSGNSLLFKDHGNVVNTFMGYVLRKD